MVACPSVHCYKWAPSLRTPPRRGQGERCERGLGRSLSRALSQLPKLCFSKANVFKWSSYKSLVGWTLKTKTLLSSLNTYEKKRLFFNFQKKTDEFFWCSNTAKQNLAKPFPWGLFCDWNQAPYIFFFYLKGSFYFKKKKKKRHSYKKRNTEAI